MKNWKLICIGLLGVCAFRAEAQYFQDALRFSQTDWQTGATARMQGLGGGHVSLGGDVSMSAVNPAGLGFYNRSSAVFSLGLGFQNSDDTFAGLTTPNFQNTFGVKNAAVVMNFNKGRFTEEKFKGGSLAISLTRVNDFNRTYRYEGATGTSITDYFLDVALGSGTLNPNALPDPAFAAYNQFLIDLYDSNNPSFPGYDEVVDGDDIIISPNSDANNLDTYTSPFGASVSEPYQQENIIEQGGQNQFNISWGGNYDDRFYFGAGVGVQTLYFRREREYLENDFRLPGNVPDPWLNSIRWTDELIARGAGVNTTFGIIARPVDFITLGVSYQSPTFLTINEESDFSLGANWNNYVYYDSLGTQEYYNLSEISAYRPENITRTKYNLKTPSRLNVGGTLFLGKAGFLTADVEFVDYANAQLRSNDFSPFEDNQVIVNAFQSVMNYRLGAEFRMDNIQFRGGYAYYPDPLDNDNDRTFITFGVGYKTADYFVDLAVVNLQTTQAYSPYGFQNLPFESPVVNSEISNTLITVTTGFNF